MGGLNPARACVLLAAPAYQSIVLSALSKVDLGKRLETGLSGMVAAQGVAGSCPLPVPVPRAAPQGCARIP